MAYAFTASSSQYLSVNAAPVSAVPLTIACWIYPNAITANYSLVVVNDGSSANRFGVAALGALAGDPVRAFATGPQGDTATDSTAGFVANSWQHVCGVFSANNSRTIYLDAANSSTNTTSTTPAGVNKTEIATRTAAGVQGLFFDGNMAEIGIWNVALTAAEIASLAAGVSCRLVRPQSLVFYAPLIRDLMDVRGGLAITNNGTATVANHPRIYA